MPIQINLSGLHHSTWVKTASVIPVMGIFIDLAATRSLTREINFTTSLRKSVADTWDRQCRQIHLNKSLSDYFMTSSLNSLLSIAAVATLISLSIISGPIPILLITLFAGNIIWNLGLKIAKSQENDDLYILHNQQWSDDTTRSTSTPQQSEKRMRIAGLVPSVIMTITIATLLAVGILAAGPIGLTALGILAALTLYLAIDHAYASQQSKKAERSTCTRMTV